MCEVTWAVPADVADQLKALLEGRPMPASQKRDSIIDRVPTTEVIVGSFDDLVQKG
jgi:hypothetical protein